MLCRKLCVAFLTLALSSITAQAAPFQNPNGQQAACSGITTVTETVTITGRAVPTGSSNLNDTTDGSSIFGSRPGGNQNGGGRGNQNGGGGKGGQNGGGKGNNGGSGGGRNNNGGTNTTAANSGTITATASAASSTTTRVNAATSTAATAEPSAGAGGDPQTSLTLDKRVIAAAFANDGQDVPTAGQVKSLTSTNNFINFCLTVPNLPITDGKQIPTGSCNPAPIGAIPSVDNMPSAKFVNPPNFGTLKANTAFTIKMAIRGMETGNFVNAQENYFAAPQQLNGQGQIIGHSHVVVEQLTSLDQATPTDPQKFAFFKGLNEAAQGGFLTADVTAGLPVGVYRVASINAAANHQPVIVPIAQHGSLDDMVYFTVTEDGNPAPGTAGGAGNTGNAGNAANTGTGAAGAATASASGAANTATGAATGTAAVPNASVTATASATDGAATATATGGSNGGNSVSAATATATGKTGSGGKATTTAAGSQPAKTSAAAGAAGQGTKDGRDGR
ncbi:hypothetical protein AMATHDRAFT_4019 [Amanita thiersii Skay4041]|uniref:Uncharacterized protein n=1 Tax=Amanita thiersii Skay4041 TaxID=703135 RepID=A0A2A9NQ52_9AGAR|nr:hypothetical protein AMATHDRAFT_4019 [Amanita thiersii Skay4041]